MVSILLVEDDQEIARIIKDHLNRQKMTVTWASTGHEGWEDFNQGKYDMAIIDLMLPEMDGFQLNKHIRLKSDVPILIISAKQEDEAKIKGLELGADDYMTKPFSLAELTARVKSHLRRYQRYRGVKEASSQYIFNLGLVIDLEKRQVLVNRQEVTLTTKEFAILALFILHPQRTFSKSELYQHVWGETDAFGSNNTVNVHIKGLRHKLGEHLKEPKWIETVWGVGYRFIGAKTS
ncbi:response regulator transcription factor [Tenuibacillus multivorans]|uniref:DNA-binding response regulator, OmpR family, contains REC and winged-helix (WHTH) domain n=1 Tax=Tenuibacillus multivorans TaxID=237069 RepID=A0A1H0BTX8_9BACI|nr:response regulator transcription factor [Tenuibacillus multivorans]GEL77037.1 DNA-binding response regulator [Tenuibacillus multivorans]SDN49046.1 DNA-binding response regulator, OmpR family, contains REC and winged-helix (wHTH) domain [Tenuibacillus multivorans]